MNDLLNFDITTTPGEVAYQKSSEDMALLFVLSVISEGYREEPKYLAYVRNICNQKSTNRVVIHIINRHYKRQVDSVGRNHPLNRLEDLLIWKKNQEQNGLTGLNDEYWLICDRDNESFKEDQYDLLIKDCTQNNVNVIVSNPAFQIWLLLHFTNNLHSFNLSQYAKSSDCIKKGIEPAIKTFYPKYKHGKINTAYFGPLIKTAIDNSAKYCYNVEELKTMIGTNFRNLLTRIESISGKVIFE